MIMVQEGLLLALRAYFLKLASSSNASAVLQIAEAISDKSYVGHE
jgi:hypothetical protein